MALLSIQPDGMVTIVISSDGVPSCVGLVLAAMMTEKKREERVNEAIDSAYLYGWFVESQTRIRNDAFDKPGEKTTTKLSLRACKTEDEGCFVLGKVEAIGNKALEVSEDGERDTGMGANNVPAPTRR